jgi:hypothetical protein
VLKLPYTLCFIALLLILQAQGVPKAKEDEGGVKEGAKEMSKLALRHV